MKRVRFDHHCINLSEGVVINIEWGNFGEKHTHVTADPSNGLLSHITHLFETTDVTSMLPWTVYDEIIDRESIHPGIQVSHCYVSVLLMVQLLEKMISGKYLGEILRQVLLAAISKNLILGGVVCLWWLVIRAQF